MSKLFSLPVPHVFDANSTALAGAKLYFFNPASTAQRTTYTDAARTVPHTHPVVADGGGRFATIYLPDGDYKVELRSASDVPVWVSDNVPGPVAASSAAATAIPTYPVVVIADDYTIVTGDRGKLLDANPTGGDLLLSLPSAVTVGDGWMIKVRHGGTANSVSLRTTGSQTISVHDRAVKRLALWRYGESVTLVSNGANWVAQGVVGGRLTDELPTLPVVDRRNTPPGSPKIGERYILLADRNGAWDNFEEHSVAEWDGDDWRELVPGDGWKAYVADESLTIEYRSADSKWHEWNNVLSPGEVQLGVMVVADERGVNTVGGSATENAWLNRTLNTVRSNTISGATLVGNQIELPTGRYFVVFNGSFLQTGNTGLRLASTDTKVQASSVLATASTVGFQLSGSGYIDVTKATERFGLEYYSAGKTATDNNLGQPRNVSGQAEVYALVTIHEMKYAQGVRGPVGPPGGPLPFYFTAEQLITASTASTAVNCSSSAGAHVYLTLQTDTVLSFTNKSADRVQIMNVTVIQASGGGHALTLEAGVLNEGGLQPLIWPNLAERTELQFTIRPNGEVTCRQGGLGLRAIT